MGTMNPVSNVYGYSSPSSLHTVYPGYEEMSVWSLYNNNPLISYPNTSPYPIFQPLPSYSHANPYYYDPALEYHRGGRPVHGSRQLFDPHAPTPATIPAPLTSPQQPTTQKLKPRIPRRDNGSFPKSPSYDSFFPSIPPQPLNSSGDGYSDKPRDGDVMALAQTEMSHILQLLPQSNAEQFPQDLIRKVEESGANIKWLDPNTPLAIYKNAPAAREAMKKIPHLQPWKVPAIVFPNTPTSPSTPVLSSVPSILHQESK
jgi:hypothetical protein